MVILQHNLWYTTACVQCLLNRKLLSMAESITLVWKISTYLCFPFSSIFWSCIRSRRVRSLEVATTEDGNAGYNRKTNDFVHHVAGSFLSAQLHLLYITFLISSSSASLSWRDSLLVRRSPPSLRKKSVVIRGNLFQHEKNKSMSSQKNQHFGKNLPIVPTTSK